MRCDECDSYLDDFTNNNFIKLLNPEFVIKTIQKFDTDILKFRDDILNTIRNNSSSIVALAKEMLAIKEEMVDFNKYLKEIYEKIDEDKVIIKAIMELKENYAEIEEIKEICEHHLKRIQKLEEKN